MALYHKWDVKNDFAYVLQFFSLISDSLGSVCNNDSLNSLNQKLVQCFYNFFVWDNFRLGEKCSANFVYFFLNELKISPTGS